jgi:hypothetical protein
LLPSRLVSLLFCVYVCVGVTGSVPLISDS